MSTTEHLRNMAVAGQGWLARVKPQTWLLGCIAACALVIVVSWIAAKSYIANHSLPQDEPARIAECRTRILSTLNAKSVDLGLLGNIHGLCYAQVNEEDILLEFGIRRSAFLNQQAQTPVMLWMVVAITLSGVVLAGMQLVAAYRLSAAGKASFEQGGQLSLEANKISLSSSVTGLAILAISLAFFYIFVSQVYLIKEVGDAPGGSVAGTPDMMQYWRKPAQKLEMQPGGLVNPQPLEKNAERANSGSPNNRAFVEGGGKVGAPSSGTSTPGRDTETRK